VNISLDSAHLRPHLYTASSGLGSLVQEKHCQIGAKPAEARQNVQGLEHLSCEGILSDGAASTWGKEGLK